jgi:hypothetical protein
VVGACLALPLLLPGRTAGAAQLRPAEPQTDCPAFPGSTAFGDEINNRYFPLRPGTTLTYRGSKDGKPLQSAFEVTRRTKVILGVTTIEIKDTVNVGGELHEQTLDWFAQDKQGNVWYFGEDAEDYEKGVVVSTEGSWEAGQPVAGPGSAVAQPGIVMPSQMHAGDPAAPEFGVDTFRQECAPGVAEDTFTITGLEQSISVPFGSFEQVVQTQETSPVKPGLVEHKWYAPCVGLVRAVMVEGGTDESSLVDVKPSTERNSCEAPE